MGKLLRGVPKAWSAMSIDTRKEALAIKNIICRKYLIQLLVARLELHFKT